MIKSWKHQLRWAWGLTKGYRWSLGIYFILEVFAICFSLSFVLFSKQAVDIAMKSSSGNLKWILFLVILSVLLGLFIRSFSGWLNERTRLRMMLDFQNRFIKTQMYSVWRFVKQWRTGDLMTRLNSDCSELVQMLSNSGVSFVLTLIRLMASLIFLWLMDPMLAIMILAISPLFLFSKIYYRRMQILSREVKLSESHVANVMQENLMYRLLIRALGLMQPRESKLLEGQHKSYNLKLKQLNFVTVTQGMMKLTINAGYLLTFIWGVYRLHHQEISFGTMTAFLQLVGRIQTPILSLIAFVPAFIRFKVSADRLSELAEVESEPEVEPEKLTQPTKVVLNNISFQYKDEVVIKDLNAQFEVGKPSAIIGASGKGKTTLIRLLLALIKPDQGNIEIENLNSDKFILSESHRLNFAYVPQGNTLFTGTIFENLQINRHSADIDEKIKYALNTACAEFVYELPDGLQTVVGESGYGLSEGQAQRIAIARALMRDSNIWLFDEATSALDEATSKILIERIMNEGKNKIIMFVTHDLKLASTCDQTIFMQ